MAKKIKIDQDLCMGCGACEGAAPEYFQLNDEGKAEVKKQYNEEDAADIEAAIDGCPGGAIEIVEE